MAALPLNLLAGGITAVGLLLSVLGLRNWLRSGEARAALLALAFLGFLAQGLLLAWGLLARNDIDGLVLPMAGLTGASLLLVYFATLFAPRGRGSRPGAR